MSIIKRQDHVITADVITKYLLILQDAPSVNGHQHQLQQQKRHPANHLQRPKNTEGSAKREQQTEHWLKQVNSPVRRVNTVDSRLALLNNTLILPVEKDLKEKNPHLVYPGRQKLAWRQKGLQILANLAEEHLNEVLIPLHPGLSQESAKINPSSIPKEGWMAEWLKTAIQKMLNDVTHFKRLAILFPPHWMIVQTILQVYHDTLQRLVKKAVLLVEGNDVVRLLDFVLHGYPKFCKHHFYQVGPKDHHQNLLLNNADIQRLKDVHVASTSASMARFIRLAVETEHNAMLINTKMETTIGGLYRRSIPLDVLQMTNEYLEVADLLGDSVRRKTLQVLAARLTNLPSMWGKSVNRYLRKMTAADGFSPDVVPNLIAVCNDCLQLRHWIKDVIMPIKDDIELKSAFEKAIEKCQGMLMETLDILAMEVVQGHKVILARVFAKDWLDNLLVQKILKGTLMDFFTDFDSHLDPLCMSPLSFLLAGHLTAEYTTQFCNNIKLKSSKEKSFKPSNSHERRRAGDQIKAEATVMETFLEPRIYNSLYPDFFNPTNAWTHPKGIRCHGRGDKSTKAGKSLAKQTIASVPISTPTPTIASRVASIGHEKQTASTSWFASSSATLNQSSPSSSRPDNEAKKSFLNVSPAAAAATSSCYFNNFLLVLVLVVMFVFVVVFLLVSVLVFLIMFMLVLFLVFVLVLMVMVMSMLMVMLVEVGMLVLVLVFMLMFVLVELAFQLNQNCLNFLDLNCLEEQHPHNSLQLVPHLKKKYLGICRVANQRQAKVLCGASRIESCPRHTLRGGTLCTPKEILTWRYDALQSNFLAWKGQLWQSGKPAWKQDLARVN
ncbi:unnamed protein product [Notodromas monacha]|uniref:Uncharacterized protein n=1 Tax=Notodromas monacha TaxID=399045 RepID=A0A7R9BXR4_9CRUS|nr:unnamed protein product [Notodromas monacha]CAG0922604.1 unnamed protein product [Notodromas monacha]